MLGYLDELVLIPLGVMAVRRLIADDVLAECRARATELEAKPKSWLGAALIIAIWLAIALAGAMWFFRGSVL